MRTNLRALTPEQIGALRQYSDRWAAIRRSTAPADRSAAEAGLRLAYRAAGLDPPERIVWCGGPTELLDATAQISRSATANVGSIVIDDVRTRVASAVKRRVHNSVRAAVANAFTLQDAERRAVSDAVGRGTTLQRLPIWLRFRRMFSWSGARRQLTGGAADPSGNTNWLGLGSTSTFTICGTSAQRRSRWKVCGNSPRTQVGCCRTNAFAGWRSAPMCYGPMPGVDCTAQRVQHCATRTAGRSTRGRAFGCLLGSSSVPRRSRYKPSTTSRIFEFVAA